MNRYIVFFLFMVYAGMAHAQAVPQATSDTIYAATPLHDVRIKARWKNDEERYRYNQMRFYVTTVLPYVNALSKLFVDVHAKLGDPNISRRELKRYISTKEDELRGQLEEHMDTLNTTQAVLLLKLTERQSNINIYKTLQEFKNPFVAVKWGAWARLNGFNLDQRYNPADEVNLESIMEDLGYPLPASYSAAAN